MGTYWLTWGFPTSSSSPTTTTTTRSTDLEAYLLDRSTTTTQTLIQRLFTLPLTRTPLGPLAQLPVSHSHAIIPREKHLPKPKPLTKWERFAKEKGISHKRKDKMVWDDEMQDWVPRWGKGGKNKDVEEAWIREVKQGDGESAESVSPGGSGPVLIHSHVDHPVTFSFLFFSNCVGPFV